MEEQMEEQKLPIEKELEQIMALGEPIEENVVGKCQCLKESAAGILLFAVEQYQASLHESILEAKRAAARLGKEQSADVRVVIARMEEEKRLAAVVWDDLHRFEICD